MVMASWCQRKFIYHLTLTGDSSILNVHERWKHNGKLITYIFESMNIIEYTGTVDQLWKVKECSKILTFFAVVSRPSVRTLACVRLYGLSPWRSSGYDCWGTRGGGTDCWGTRGGGTDCWGTRGGGTDCWGTDCWGTDGRRTDCRGTDSGCLVLSPGYSTSWVYLRNVTGSGIIAICVNGVG